MSSREQLPPDVALRFDLQPSDPAAIREITSATGFFSPAEVDIAVELADERLQRGDASGYHFVLAECDRPVAYACYGPIPCTIGSFDLYWIVVAPEAQRQGLGRRLLDECERLIRGQSGRRIYVDTSGRPQYQPTRTFYERCGYRVEAVLRDFYALGDDKVVLGKQLDPEWAGGCC